MLHEFATLLIFARQSQKCLPTAEDTNGINFQIKLSKLCLSERAKRVEESTGYPIFCAYIQCEDPSTAFHSAQDDTAFDNWLLKGTPVPTHGKGYFLIFD